MTVGLLHFLRDRRGATAVEFALLLPIMLALIAGVFEYSRVLLAQHMVRDIVDEAARTGVVKYQSDATVKASIKADVDDVPGVGSHIVDVTSSASSLSVKVSVSMDLAFGDILPSNLINFTISNEYPK